MYNVILLIFLSIQKKKKKMRLHPSCFLFFLQYNYPKGILKTSVSGPVENEQCTLSAFNVRVEIRGGDNITKKNRPGNSCMIENGTCFSLKISYS